MSDTNIEKRLHISGLTPSITAADLTRRLGTYGSVTALDGLGTLDALGNPRSFAYATLRAPKAQIAKCVSALSGATWKGAKLRVGEARPDFRERIALENEQEDSPRPRKRRRIAMGKHATDMTPVTSERASASPAWRVTPLGRLIRPLRMRPARPLDPPLDLQRGKDTTKKPGKKKSARVREPPIRARRKLIDPLRWGSSHVQGIFLEDGLTGARQSPEKMKDTSLSSSSGESSEDEGAFSSPGHAHSGTIISDTQAVQFHSRAKSSSPPLPPPRIPSPKPQPLPSHSAPISGPEDLVAEKNSSLALLSRLFGAADSVTDWGGAEELSDVDLDAVDSARAAVVDVADEFEIVPRDGVHTAVAEDEIDEAMESHTSGDVPVPSRDPAPTPMTAPAPTQMGKLKDLFAPREEEGFSLLGHLDLDLDLDLELDDAFMAPAVLVPTTTSPAFPPASSARTKAPGMPIPSSDSALPLFFPTSAQHGRVSSILHALGAISPARAFSSAEDEDARRAHWEEVKGELTRSWKKRHREAVKLRRRKGGEAV